MQLFCDTYFFYWCIPINHLLMMNRVIFIYWLCHLVQATKMFLICLLGNWPHDLSNHERTLTSHLMKTEIKFLGDFKFYEAGVSN